MEIMGIFYYVRGLDQIAPFFSIVSVIFTTVFLGKKAHQFDKTRFPK